MLKKYLYPRRKIVYYTFHLLLSIILVSADVCQVIDVIESCLAELHLKINSIKTFIIVIEERW